MNNRPEWWLKITRRFYHPDYIIPWLQWLRPLVDRVDMVILGRKDNG